MSDRVTHRRLPALDGIRALAVVAVLAYHGGLASARGGFLGVDVFFVLSGYLITSLLLAEWERSGTVALRAFWLRRAKRLLPALFLLLVAVAVYARATALPDALSTFRRDALAALAYVANWRFILAGRSYFGRSASPSLLQHTWSLAIEEQFYLVWPLVLVAILARRRARIGALLGLAVGLALGSAVEMGLLYRSGHDPSRVYFGTDTHAQGVLVGAVLAIALFGRLRGTEPGLIVRSPAWSAIGYAGLAVTLGAFVWMSSGSPVVYRGGMLAVDVAAACVILSVVRRPESSLGRALSVGPLRAIGAVSYGLYLWHWPVFLILDRSRTGLAGVPLLAARTAVTAVIATASYHLVEMPIREGRWHVRRPRLVVPAALASVAAAIVAATVPSAAMVSSAAGVSSAGAAAFVRPAVGAAPAPASPERSAVPSRPVRVLVEGDSVALTLGLELSLDQARYGLTIDDRGKLGCGVAVGDVVRDRGNVARLPSICAQWPTTWAAEVAGADADLAVLLAGRWDVMDRVFQGRWTHIGDPSFDRDLLSQLEQAVNVLSHTGAHVVLLTMPCESEGEQPDGSAWPQDDPARIARFNDLLALTAAWSGGKASVVDLAGIVCPGGRYVSSFDGLQVRTSDGVHFTVGGGRWLGPRLLPQLADLAVAGGAAHPGVTLR